MQSIPLFRLILLISLNPCRKNHGNAASYGVITLQNRVDRDAVFQ
jgi:hypothetical protein